MTEVVFKKESFQIIGICYEVHRTLGPGFLEIVYKDAMEKEFQKFNIHYEREKVYDITYKQWKLPYRFYADFVVMDKIILELKAATAISDIHIAQAVNYLKASQNKLALIVNFGEVNLQFKRIVL